jgi:hypothetical protein
MPSTEPYPNSIHPTGFQAASTSQKGNSTFGILQSVPRKMVRGTPKWEQRRGRRLRRIQPWIKHVTPPRSH